MSEAQRLVTLVGALEGLAAPTEAWTVAEWSAVADRARRSGVAGVFLAGLPEHAPAELRADLRQATLASAGWALRVSGQLTELLAAARAAGVEVMLLKGAALIHTAYERPSLRTFGDLDLLVRRADLPAVAALSAALGYTERQEPEVGHHLRTRVRPGALAVEWHWRPVATGYAPGLDEAELAAQWARARRLTVGHEPALAPASADLLLHLAAHWALCNRCAGGPRPVLDLAVGWRAAADELDHAELWARAERWGVRAALALGLSLAHELLGVPDAPPPVAVPAEVRARARARLANDETIAPSGRLADAASAGAATLLAAAWRARGGWRALWAQHGPLLRAALRPGRWREVAAERRLARWLNSGS